MAGRPAAGQDGRTGTCGTLHTDGGTGRCSFAIAATDDEDALTILEALRTRGHKT